MSVLPGARPFDRSVLETCSSTSPTSTSVAASTRCAFDAKVEEESGNRVRSRSTSRRARAPRSVRSTIVGNQTFTDAQIIQSFELKTPNWLSWYKQDDRYSSESLQGIWKKLRSFYMDRGYANFQVESTQVRNRPGEG